MQIIPIQSLANQTLTCYLGGQQTSLNIYQKSTGMFMDVYVGNTLIIGGVICLNQRNIVRDAYLGFIGDFFWVDTYGTGSDPTYTGLGTQFQLWYVEADETFLG